MIWIVLAGGVALVAVVLGVCALVAWREPVRRGGYLPSYTERPRPTFPPETCSRRWARPKGTKR